VNSQPVCSDVSNIAQNSFVRRLMLVRSGNLEGCAMILDDIPTEVLIKMRERFQSGRTHFYAVTATVAWMQECERKVNEAVEAELCRRLN
jgi:hypothetical protein